MVSKIYGFFVEKLVESHPIINREFSKYCRQREKRTLLGAGMEAIKLNVKYRMFKGITSNKSKYRRLKFPETEQVKIDKLEKNQILDLVNKYDIISFDVFDTLIFRPFEDPKDLFYMVGIQLGIGDFKKYRENAEIIARQQYGKDNNEICIEDIYNVLKKQFNVDNEAIQCELELEEELCYANDYLKDLFFQILNANKKIIITSDMYLHSESIIKILKKCGYYGYDKVFVSCESGFCKGNGTLQRYISSLYPGKRILHIGDNEESDVKQSKRLGWGVVHYRNTRTVNSKYRQNQMRWLTGSIYNGLVSNYFYSDIKKKSLYYEFGFLCGGIIAWGFCQWLNQICKQDKIDKILFLARDCDVIYKVYKKYFNAISSEYVHFSRVASEKLILSDWFEEYLVQCVALEFSNTKKQQTILELLHFCELDFMVPIFEKEKIDVSQLHTKVKYEDIRDILYNNKNVIIQQFMDKQEAGHEYIKSIVGDAKKVCVVDLGWRGSSIVYLKHLIEKKYALNVEVKGALVVADNLEYSDGFQTVGIIKSFVNTWENKEIEHIARVQKTRVALECLFSSEESSLLSFEKNSKGELEFKYCGENKEASKTREIQNGIIDYIDNMNERLGIYSYKMRLAAYDCFVPVINLFENKKLVKKILEKSNTMIGARHGKER